MIHGSEDAVLWLQLSDPLTVGMFGDLRRKVKKKNETKAQTGKCQIHSPFFQVKLRKSDLLYSDVQQQLGQHGYDGQAEESRQGVDGPHCREAAPA